MKPSDSLHNKAFPDDKQGLVPTLASEQPSLIQYPCDFPIKIMGLKQENFVSAIVYIAKQFDASFDETSIELRDSANGKYQSITITIKATSREQLDSLYQTLSTHPMVKIVL